MNCLEFIQIQLQQVILDSIYYVQYFQHEADLTAVTPIYMTNVFPLEAGCYFVQRRVGAAVLLRNMNH